jgi:hypothetical protein
MVLFTGVNFYIAKRIGRLTGEMMAKKVGCLPSRLHLHFIAGNCVCVCACVRVRVFVRTWTDMQDERVRVCTEVLQGIRVVKMHAWEAPLLERIRIARSVEMQKLGKLGPRGMRWLWEFLDAGETPRIHGTCLCARVRCPAQILRATTR